MWSGEKGTLVYCCWEYRVAGAATLEDGMEFPHKIKMDLPFDLVISLLGIYAMNPKTPIQKNICIFMIIVIYSVN